MQTLRLFQHYGQMKQSILLTKIWFPAQDIRRYICRRTPLVLQQVILTTQVLSQTKVGNGNMVSAAI
jgi:hypothetical protein